PSMPMPILEPHLPGERPPRESSLWPSINDSDPWGFADGPDAEEDDSSAEKPLPPGVDRRTTRGFLKDRLLRLNLLSQAIASELDLDKLLDAIIDAVLEFTGFERGLLLLVEEGGELKPILGRKLDVASLPPEERNFSRK